MPVISTELALYNTFWKNEHFILIVDRHFNYKEDLNEDRVERLHVSNEEIEFFKKLVGDKDTYENRYKSKIIRVTQENRPDKYETVQKAMIYIFCNRYKKTIKDATKNVSHLYDFLESLGDLDYIPVDTELNRPKISSESIRTEKQIYSDSIKDRMLEEWAAHGTQGMLQTLADSYIHGDDII